MKKFGIMTALLSVLILSACKIEEDSKTGNDDIIPNNIPQSGVRGSWGHVVVTPTDLVYAKELYITKTETTFVNRCNFVSGEVVAGVRVSSKIEGLFLKLLGSDNKLVQDGEQTCYTEVSKDAQYGLSLVSDNVLEVTHSGSTTRYTRIDTDE